MTTVKFYKTIFRFHLFDSPIDHFHKLISPLSIEFIMALRLQYVCILMYCDILASGPLFTETTKRIELNWFNVAITTTRSLGLKWLPTVSWKVGRMEIFAFSNRSLGYFRKEKAVRRARGCCVHVFLVADWYGNTSRRSRQVKNVWQHG